MRPIDSCVRIEGIGNSRKRLRLLKPSAQALLILCWLAQYCFKPSAHGAQRWQLSTVQPTPTLSPTLSFDTRSPTAVTRPTVPWPGTEG